jgi:uncharacterized protein
MLVRTNARARATFRRSLLVQSNTAIHAAAVDLAHEPVPAEQSVRGQPSTGAVELDDFGGLKIGIWEMSPGVMTDVEADEVFVVLTGSATIEFADGSPTLEVGAGDVVRLAEGAATTWTVTETLRKIYLT